MPHKRNPPPKAARISARACIRAAEKGSTDRWHVWTADCFSRRARRRRRFNRSELAHSSLFGSWLKRVLILLIRGHGYSPLSWCARVRRQDHEAQIKSDTRPRSAVDQCCRAGAPAQICSAGV